MGPKLWSLDHPAGESHDQGARVFPEKLPDPFPNISHPGNQAAGEFDFIAGRLGRGPDAPGDVMDEGISVPLVHHAAIARLVQGMNHGDVVGPALFPGRADFRQGGRHVDVIAAVHRRGIAAVVGSDHVPPASQRLRQQTGRLREDRVVVGVIHQGDPRAQQPIAHFSGLPQPLGGVGDGHGLFKSLGQGHTGFHSPSLPTVLLYPLMDISSLEITQAAR